jgi:hypothetical protein
MEESLTLSVATKIILIMYQMIYYDGTFDNVYLLICEAEESLSLRLISWWYGYDSNTTY